MSAATEFQKAILAALVADSAVHAIVADRIFDRMPSDADYPCVTFGPSQSIPMNLQCLDARTEVLQLDCWVRAQGRIWPARELADAVKSALHGANLQLYTHALAQIEVEQVRVMLDRDGITAHGIVTVEATLEEK